MKRVFLFVGIDDERKKSDQNAKDNEIVEC